MANEQTGTVGLVTEGAWYTQAEMLDAARQRRHTVSQGLIEKWVGLGLLAQGTRKGRGQGRGVTFLWSENQLQLFFVLLEKRSTVARVRVLANLPVAVWLYWGEGYIPLQQVRRAMETWADVGRPRARHDWNAMARRIVARIADGTSTKAQQEAAADVIAELVRDRSVDDEGLRSILMPIVGPSKPAAFADAPRVAELLVAQVRALAQIQEIPDEIFRWARAVILYGQADYQRVRPRLAEDPRFGSMHPDQVFEDFVATACQHLTTTLGLFLVRPEAPGLPGALDPELWKAGRARLTSSAVYEPSPLMLPPWADGGRMRVEVHIEIDPQ